MNFTFIESANAYEGFCLVKSVTVRRTARGSNFLDLILADSTGEIGAKLWDYKEELHGVVAVNDLIKIRGTLSPFNGEDQLRVDRIRKATPDDGVKMDDFVPNAPKTGEWMLAQIEGILLRFEDEALRTLTQEILENHRERLLFFPAAFKLHHAVRGGLLYHTLSIVRLAQQVCALYPFLDKDLLLCGAILHDIGKTYEFNADLTGIAENYTLEGNLVGHIAIGATLVRNAAQKLGTPKETALLVEHMILSHHGDPEFGAAVRPQFIEAEILSQLDLLDARVYEMAHAVSAVPTGEFSARQWALDNRRFYNHGRKELPADANLEE